MYQRFFLLLCDALVDSATVVKCLQISISIMMADGKEEESQLSLLKDLLYFFIKAKKRKKNYKASDGDSL